MMPLEETSDMAAKKKAEAEGLTVQLGIRVTPADNERLNQHADRYSGVTKNAIARAALLRGLDEIDDDPLILLGEKPKKGGR